MPVPTTNIKLSPDEVDDLIYFSRTADLESLTSTITTLSQTHNSSASTIIRSAIDVDDEGLGSQSCLLHYPAANGNVTIVNHLLSLLSAADSTPEALAFVNHRNVSGNTPLHWAGVNGHLDAVKALVRAGADPEIVNGAGRDAVVEAEYSAKEGAAECAVWILKECGALEKGVAGINDEGGEEEEGEEGADEEQDVIVRMSEGIDDGKADG